MNYYENWYAVPKRIPWINTGYFLFKAHVYYLVRNHFRPEMIFCRNLRINKQSLELIMIRHRAPWLYLSYLKNQQGNCIFFSHFLQCLLLQTLSNGQQLPCQAQETVSGSFDLTGRRAPILYHGFRVERQKFIAN